jgi:flagellar basal body P-ring formation protein FlgA
VKDRLHALSCAFRSKTLACGARLMPSVLAGGWLATAGLAQAELPAALPAASLAHALALAQQAAARLAPAGAQVSASLGTLDARLRPAPCAQAEAFLPRGVPAWGRTRAGLRCTQGPVAWTLYLPIQVRVQAPALSVRSALPAGSVLTESDLVSASVDWSAHPQPALTDAAATAGRTLARAATPGQPLREDDLLARRWFAAGDRVKVLAGGPGFAVAAEGQALADGRDGQRVRVQIWVRPQDGSNSLGPVVQGLAVGDRLVALKP